ncbi:tetratricopeptide repeat protein, partial [Microcoleus sp. Pol11C2]|uniref:tetratricopeptide repeat protein n=1 Tax=Microcoleus sp. Pol11C2 TaxID=3055389 RepID=UPI002FCFB5C2
MKNKKQIALIQSLLNSSREEQIVILEKNLKLIDDDFARVLRKWATKTLEKVKFSEAQNIIIKILNFSALIQQFPLGSKSSNIEIAIAGFKLGMKIFNRYTSPQDWATTQNNLATAYYNRTREDRAENIEKAIACYDLALEVLTRADFPQQWAGTQNNLAIAYKDRIREDKAENLEKAIACYDLALLVYTRDAFPQQWAG